MAGQEPSMRSSEPYFWLDPGNGAKFREFPKASEERGHALTVAELQPLQRGWYRGDGGMGAVGVWAQELWNGLRTHSTRGGN